MVGGVHVSPPRLTVGRGRRGRRGSQRTPVSAGRRNAASFFLEEEERGRVREAEGWEDEGEQENPESAAEEEGQGGDDQEWLPVGAAAVVGCLAEAARALDESDIEEELQEEVDKIHPVRVQGESQELLDRNREFLQGLAAARAEEEQVEEEEQVLDLGPDRTGEEQVEEEAQVLGLAADRTGEGQVEEEEQVLGLAAAGARGVQVEQEERVLGLASARAGEDQRPGLPGSVMATAPVQPSVQVREDQQQDTIEPKTGAGEWSGAGEESGAGRGGKCGGAETGG